MFRNLIFIALFAFVIFGTYQSSYPSQTPKDLMYNGFWLENAVNHVKKISKAPHPTGSTANRDVRRYLIQQLSLLGAEVTTQKTQAYNPRIRKAAPVHNIVALFKSENTKAEDFKSAELSGQSEGQTEAKNERKKLMLMTHYDSAKPFSHGAADAGSGVAVILEAMRGFLKQQTQFKNDIVVMFTDGEELGLLGAHAFVEQHHLADSIGMILNFEARGTSGPAIMWPESIGGTAAMISSYQQAQAEFPVTSSLIYEVYKLLPNDTDMTVFKEEKGINGLNFAFIDNHFYYHTRNDDARYLSYNSLMHQGLQLSAMLPVLSDADLSALYADDDRVYFTLPALGLFNWPAWSAWVLLALAWLLFLVVVKQNKTQAARNFSTDIKKGIKTWLLSMLLSGGLSSFLVFALYQWLTPQHNDILQGYPYLGYGYLLSVLLMALVVPFMIYGNNEKSPNVSQSIPPMTVWLLALSLLSIKLPGASYLLMPVIVSCLLMLLLGFREKLGVSFSVLFALSGLLFVALLLTLLPVALGLKSAWIAALLLTSCVCLFAPMVATHKKSFSWAYLVLPLALFFWVNSNDQISQDMPLPTSLSYLYDADEEKGWYYSFDRNKNDWNESYLAQPLDQDNSNAFISKHKQVARKIQAAEKNVPLSAAQMTVVEDRLNTNPLKQNIIYQGSPKTDIVQIYSLKDITIEEMSINGRYTIHGEPVTIRKGSRLIEYHLDGQKELNMQVTLAEGGAYDWQIISHQFDLLHHRGFSVPERPIDQIPKPFVLTDNTAISQRFQIETPVQQTTELNEAVNDPEQ